MNGGTVSAGKVIAITGASSGIGEAIAIDLAARGMKVVLGARGEDRLAALAERIAGQQGEVAYVRTDVARRDDVERLVALASERFGGLDVMVSNAGVMPIGPIDRLAVDDWEQMVDVNLKGVLYGIAAALPVFCRRGGGHFITIASTAARKTMPDQVVYSATKAAVLALCDGLRQELAGRCRVTTISPGFTDTRFAEHVKDDALRAKLNAARSAFAMPAAAVAKAVAYAIEQPDDVNVGEIVIRSTAQA